MSDANDIALAVSARIGVISKANGYGSDIGLRVMRGRRRINPEQLPCAVIIERDDQPEDQSLGKVKVTTRFIIEGHDKCDPDNPNDRGHELIADIKRAVFHDMRLLYGQNRAIRLQYRGRSIAPREDGIDVVSAAVEVSVSFVEDLSKP